MKYLYNVLAFFFRTFMVKRLFKLPFFSFSFPTTKADRGKRVGIARVGRTHASRRAREAEERCTSDVTSSLSFLVINTSLSYSAHLGLNIRPTGEANSGGADAAGSQRSLGGGNHPGGGRSRGRDGAERRGGRHHRSHGGGLLKRSTTGATARAWFFWPNPRGWGRENNKVLSEI